MVGNDISGFADPDYLPAAAAEPGATVVATHIRLGPRIPDPEPVYDDVVGDVRSFLLDRAGRRPRRRASPPSGSCSTPASTWARRRQQSLTLLRASRPLAGLGYPLLLSASNKTFLGVVLGLELAERREASIGAAALGTSSGAGSCGCTRSRAPAGRATCSPPSAGPG